MMAASVALYLVLFLLFQWTYGQGRGFFALIPILTAGVVFGLKAGLVVGLVAHPINVTLLYVFAGNPINAEDVGPSKLVAWGFSLMLGTCGTFM